MKLPKQIRNLLGNTAYQLIRHTYPPNKTHYAISWLAAKLGCFNIINQEELMKTIIKEENKKTTKQQYKYKIPIIKIN